jgi:hypothetical protein
MLSDWLIHHANEYLRQCFLVVHHGRSFDNARLAGINAIRWDEGFEAYALTNHPLPDEKS